ncbi:MAG: hypothetical protein V3T81_02885 [Thermoanaerobaculia bacterium]
MIACVARVLALCALVGSPIAAFETDQYLAWEQELEDSTDRVNGFVNDETVNVLERINRSGRPDLTCEEIPFRIYHRFFGSLLRSRIRHFLATDPEIDRFPDRKVGYFGYIKRSVFRKPAFPFFLPMARTLRIDGINLGADKLGHLFGFGRRYYARYRRLRRRGLSEQEAMRRVVLWGYRMERIAVGGLVDGVVSHADLEANFQGLRLARNLCEAEPPHLVRGDQGWRLERPIDLRDYVNPRFDETYNQNRFTRLRWMRVKPILEKEYCRKYRTAAVQGLMSRYRARDRPSFASAVIAEHTAKRGYDLRRRAQSLEVLCATDRAVASVAAAPVVGRGRSETTPTPRSP